MPSRRKKEKNLLEISDKNKTEEMKANNRNSSIFL
jgi:hypothetical protein